MGSVVLCGEIQHVFTGEKGADRSESVAWNTSLYSDHREQERPPEHIQGSLKFVIFLEWRWKIASPYGFGGRPAIAHGHTWHGCG